GSELELPREDARQVTLIRKTGRCRRRRKRAAVPNQHSRPLGAAAQQPRVRRQSVCAFEPAQHLIAAQPCEPGQLREIRYARRIVAEALADLADFRGWRSTPPRRAMPRHQAHAACDQSFLEREGIHLPRVWRAIIPALESRKQALQHPGEQRIGDHRIRDLGASPLGCRQARHYAWVDIDDAPASRRRADRPAVVDFTGIGRDDVAGVAAHDAAATEPLLRAVLQESKSIGVVPVPAELLRAVDVRAVDAWERGGEDAGDVLLANVHLPILATSVRTREVVEGSHRFSLMTRAGRSMLRPYVRSPRFSGAPRESPRRA